MKRLHIHQQQINLGSMFSITIPAFKKKFLLECIQSILEQTFTDFEIVIVNDNSPEDLDSIVNTFTDKRIRYYKNDVGFGAENVVGNWNKCIEYAKGDFIICMGDDDRLKPNFLADLNELIMRYPGLDVFYSRTEIINEKSEVVQVLEERPEHESVYEMIQQRKEGRSMFVGDYCYRTNTLRGKGGFFNLPYAWGSDAITAYMLAGQKGIANTKEPGFQYRVNSQTISSSSSNVEGKMEAIMKERNWFRQFYEIIPVDEDDSVLFEALKSDNDGYFERMASGDLIKDINNYPIVSSFKWLRGRKKYGFSLSFIVKCIARGIFKF